MVSPGEVLDGKYEIIDVLGKGGMSTVYLAVDMRLNKRWAVKEITVNRKKNYDIVLKSIRMEAEILRKADHPVLPGIVDVIYSVHALYVVMDYIEGITLEEVVKAKGPQPQNIVTEWAKSLCEALIYLHDMTPPVIYRDMKPSNIMLKPDGKVKLIDFGTAKESGADHNKCENALGTIGFAAPEQFGDKHGKEIVRTDERTDVYCLGVTIYYLLTGIKPDRPAYELKPLNTVNPAISTGLSKIVSRATMKEPGKRYKNCRELLVHLENYHREDDEARQRDKANLKSFLITLIIAVCFLVMSLCARSGNIHELQKRYDGLMDKGYRYTASGEYENAAKVYMSAITEVDGSRDEAYMELLKLYVNYINDPDTGLSYVTYYIKQDYSGIGDHELLILQVAMIYFEKMKDYRESAVYFSMLSDDGNKKDDGISKGYKTISLLLSSAQTDYALYGKELLSFEKANREYPDRYKKMINYRLLCNAYSVCTTDDSRAYEGMKRCAMAGIDLLDGAEELLEQEMDMYIAYKQFLSVACEELGDYEKAIACCDDLLSVIIYDGKTFPSEKEVTRIREAKYCQKARIYEKQNRYEKACSVYEAAEKEKDYALAYIGHLSLLCRMEAEKTTDVESWNYELLHPIYEKGNKLEGVNDDYRWKRLSAKLMPLFEKYSELP